MDLKARSLRRDKQPLVAFFIITLHPLMHNIHTYIHTYIHTRLCASIAKDIAKQTRVAMLKANVKNMYLRWRMEKKSYVLLEQNWQDIYSHFVIHRFGGMITGII